MVGLPHFLSSTTVRPRGPRVTFTASATLLTPLSRARRAFSSYKSVFAAIVLLWWRLVQNRVNLVLVEDGVLLALDRYFVAAVFAEEHAVARLNRELVSLAGIENASTADC